MKFLSIYLQNYIGIYNGMGLSEIHIDMSKCRNRITIIRGDNGSGKSTLSKAMSLFPDPNDAFIPGLQARKEIVLDDHGTLYRLSFHHGIKQNGERETTKAYITKTFNGVAVELNENGNVSSYKDILYNELGLDANFAALSQLSNDDRGLADKKPAERKKFVNSIISSLDTYNNIYKVLTKRSSNYKSMINAVVAKLSVLGDENALVSNLEAVEGKINMLQDKKDKAFAELAKKKSMIEILDPDGSIMNNNTLVNAELKKAEQEESAIQSIIDGLMLKIANKDIQAGLRATTDKKNSLIVQNQIDRNSIESLLNQKEVQVENLNKKLNRLSTLQSDDSYSRTKEKADECIRTLKSIENDLKAAGVSDPSELSKEEYILALETFKALNEYISSFKSGADFETIRTLVSGYIQSGKIPDRVNIQEQELLKVNEENNLKKIESDIVEIQSKMSLLTTLELRPSTCVDNSCAFIKDAVDFANTNPNERIAKLEAEKMDTIDRINSISAMIKMSESFNDSANALANIVREVERNRLVLAKIHGEDFANKYEFFERLMAGDTFDYMVNIYSFINLANLFDIYKATSISLRKYQDELKAYAGKTEIIDSLNEEISAINTAISGIVDKIEPINQQIADRELQIVDLQDLEGIYTAIIDQQEKKKPITEKIANCRIRLTENTQKISEIRNCMIAIESLTSEINQYTVELTPLMKDRDKLNHSVQMMRDYQKEKEELQMNYEYIETIKYYSSPTTGIQLVFMELYMGKIIALANELLRLLFDGRFVIQPFVINESEFRIPCLGSGYLNDDISSMSSSQIGMISMILSFALLHHSSTKYNIIKLDEIDGPLDYNNRMYFMDVLNSIMDIMGTEQCIMISHNSELQVDNSDVILLKHDVNNSDYRRGNIIWSY